ncbi:MAG: anti-sigma factor [Chloroflexota bacterium]
MFTLRKLPVSILLVLVLTLLVSVSVASAADPAVGGKVTFRDSSGASNSLVIALTDVPSAGAGNAYEGWLIAGDGSKISVGVLARRADGVIDATYEGTANLLATYVAFAISREPSPDPDPATAGTIVYSDNIPAGAVTTVRGLVVDGSATALRAQAQLALTHANLAKTSATLADKQSHAQHVVNIIDGLGAPGDGTGVLAHAATVAAAANALAGKATDTRVAAAANEVAAGANNTAALATRARDAAQRLVNATVDNITVALELENVVNLASAAVNGTDENGDGINGNVGAEAGGNGTYTLAQDIAAFEPQAGADLAKPDTGDWTIPVLALLALVAGAGLTLGGLTVRRNAA